jgi:5-methylcytosine-specific restriction endonuclease McrA
VSNVQPAAPNHCPVCGVEVFRKSKYGPEPRYCGASHRSLWCQMQDPERHSANERARRAAKGAATGSRISYGDCIDCGCVFVIRAQRAKRCKPCRMRLKQSGLAGGKLIRCGICNDTFYGRGGTGKQPTACARCRGAEALAERSCMECGATFRMRAHTQRRCTACSTKWRSAKNYRRRVRTREAADLFTASEVFERDNWRCHLCGKRVRRAAVHPHPLAPTLDHLIPLADGGGHCLANVRCAHSRCNLKKGRRPANEQLMLLG